MKRQEIKFSDELVNEILAYIQRDPAVRLLGNIQRSVSEQLRAQAQPPVQTSGADLKVVEKSE